MGTVRRVRSLLASAALSAVLAACAGNTPRTVTVTDAELDAHIAEASRRFDMPEHWIREVMRQESGGRTMLNGKPIVSKAGAMGLMQVMPGTYEEMRRKHGLGSDPFDPRDNVLAGTAYLREMYNLFGAPGFLGAYNCGPGCYGDYLAGNRSLPGETRRYLAAVGPRLNRVPGPNGSDIVVASAPRTPPSGGSVEVAALPPPRPVHTPPPVQTTVVAPEPARPIAPPVIRTAAVPPAPTQVAAAGLWTVQLGAFRSPDDGAKVIDRARRQLPGMLDRTQHIVQAVDTKAGPLYRARLSGLSQQNAADTCANLVDRGMACFVVAPGA